MSTHPFGSSLRRTLLAALALAILPWTARGQGNPDINFSGNATTYAGGVGACGFPASEVSPFFAAMNAAQYNSGNWCGAWVRVTGPAGTAIVQIVDKLPTNSPGDLDLSAAAFAQITGGQTSGIYPITWHWVSAPGNLGPIHFYSQGSNPFYLKLQAANVVNPVKKMEMLFGGSYVAMTPTSPDNFFVFTGQMITEPFTIRVTDVRDNLVVSPGLTIAATANGQNGSGNFPAVADADITVEQPAGTPVVDGGTRDIGYSIDGSSASLQFTVRNAGSTPLTISSATIDGANAANFTVVSPPASTVAPGGTTTFVVAFASPTAGARNAALHLVNSSANPTIATYDILLTGRAVSSANDTDGDGMNDAAEVRLAALGFDWQVAQPQLVALYYNSAATAGLYTAAQIQAMNVGVPLLQRNPTTGRFTLTLELKKSADLATFAPFPFTAAGLTVNAQGKLEFSFTTGDNTAFLRLGAQ